MKAIPLLEELSPMHEFGFYPTRGERELKETLEKRPKIIMIYLGYKGRRESIEGHYFGKFKGSTISVIGIWCNKENRIKTKGIPGDLVISKVKIK